MLPQFSNTMSVLFSYSQDRLKETFGDGIRGILTSIKLLYLYNKDERKKLSESPIYVVSENDYLFNR